MRLEFIIGNEEDNYKMKETIAHNLGIDNDRYYTAVEKVCCCKALNVRQSGCEKGFR